MARKGRAQLRLRWLAALLLVGLISAAATWWHLRGWTPPRHAWPLQGAEIGETDGAVDFRALKAVGADFVYLDASASAFARDPAFVRNLDAARSAGLQIGAVHRYDPCQPADRQAANFVTVVPRDAAMLPSAVELEALAENCPTRVSDAAIESELTTFLNQVETHTGKPVILKLGRAFEKRYRVASAIDRNLWLTRTRFQPEYGKRPWMLWTANSGYRSPALPGAVRWVVVQP
ncbi:MAG TPA: glycoside hydrolase family 25 protein [Novosphingobium sp.]|nr:glycoside hydrolase family 25 protein [Novosphingobium sp.]